MLTMAIPDTEIWAVRLFAVCFHALVNVCGSSGEFEGIGLVQGVESCKIVYSYLWWAATHYTACGSTIG